MHIPNGLIRHNGLFGRTKKPPSKIESQHKFKKRNHRDGYFVCRLETFSMSQSISELVALNFYHIGSADTGQWSVVLGESRKCFQKKKIDISEMVRSSLPNQNIHASTSSPQ